MRLFNLLLLTVMCSCIKTNAQSLSDYRWENRILLLVDESKEAETLQSQLKIFTKNKKALQERDLIIYLATPQAIYRANGETSGLNASETFKALGKISDFKGVILLGKDGGIKLKEKFEIRSQDIFALIDGMPMRQSEMRKGH